MPKAILELPKMPESCWQCPCIQDRSETYRWCGAVGGDCPNPPNEKRRDDCPLKLVDENAIAAWNSSTSKDINVITNADRIPIKESEV